jgi:hypothetical protein
MTKLSPAQDKAIKAFAETGDFPKGTRAATIEGIRSAGLIFHWNGDDSWDLTPDGRAYLGLPALADTATTDEILAELNTNPWDVPVTEGKPFVVQQLFGNVWTRVGRSAATWGTANVWRNRMSAQGLTVRVHNMISDQVWA